MITGHYWSSLERMLVSEWYKYVNLDNWKYNHTVEVVCTTAPQVVTKHKVLRWKNSKWNGEKGCKSQLKNLVILRWKISRSIYNSKLKFYKNLQNERFGSFLTGRNWKYRKSNYYSKFKFWEKSSGWKFGPFGKDKSHPGNLVTPGLDKSRSVHKSRFKVYKNPQNGRFGLPLMGRGWKYRRSNSRWHTGSYSLAPIKVRKWTDRAPSKPEETKSGCRQIPFSGWYKYIDIRQFEYSHTVELVEATVPRNSKGAKVPRWKHFKQTCRRSCKSHSRKLVILRLRKSQDKYKTNWEFKEETSKRNRDKRMELLKWAWTARRVDTEINSA